MADRIARVWTGSIWEPISSPVSVPNAVAYFQASSPSTPATGTIWVDSDDNTQWVYNGVSWVQVLGSGVTLTGTETLTNKTLTDPKITIVINAQTGTSYTLALTDRDKIVELSNAAAITLTVPLNSSIAFPIGSSVMLTQTGAGQVTVAPAGGVTINATPGLKLRTQWSSGTLYKRATDSWMFMGDITA